MDITAYMNYCPPGQPFFDVPERDHGRFALSDAAVPEGWRRVTDPDWVNVLPPAPLATQGWKVHVSATLDNCTDVLRICWDHCTGAGVAFKFLKSTEVLFGRSSKYGDRSASGKFVTIYPSDESALERLLGELGTVLDGYTGPTILSDLRWRDGPLYVRYGGFVRLEMRTDAGEQVYALEGPDGALVPDERRPGFHVPEWIELPPVLQEAIEARGRGRLADFPYRPKEALHFSNGGGVYRGVDAEGSVVILKEARPHAGIDGTGDDAVARLERERWALEELAGMPEMPRLIDYRRGHEHYFLVREQVEGVPLLRRSQALNPLLRPGARRADFVEYTAWALSQLDAIERGVAEMHARGVAYRDLHPGNVLVRPDDTLAFIDLEAARPVGEEIAQAIGAPGYIAPQHVRGVDVDRYALGIFALDLFVPLAHLVPWGQHKIDEIMELVEREFPVPADYAARVRRHLDPPPRAAVLEQEPGECDAVQPPVVVEAQLVVEAQPIPAADWGPPTGEPAGGVAWLDLARRLADGIVASATPDRTDRLYPGDPPQFARPTGGLGFLHGAAGVLWALARSGIEAPDEHREWFRRSVDAGEWDRCGVSDGLSGVALALHELGEQDRAHDVLDRALRLGREPTTGRLVDGLAGLGLTAITLAAKDGSLIREAERLVPRVADWTFDLRDRRWGPGLLGGPSGPALFYLRLHEATGDAGLLDRAEAAVRAELAGWGWDPEAPELPEGTVGATSLAAAGGTALVLHALLGHRTSPDLERARDLLREACSVPFTAESGLLYGRAGLMTVLAGLGGHHGTIERHARDLRVHGLLLDGEPVVAGRFALRASCDLASGSAGVLLALGALRGETRLPFDSPAGDLAVAGPDDQRS